MNGAETSIVWQGHPCLSGWSNAEISGSIDYPLFTLGAPPRFAVIEGETIDSRVFRRLPPGG